MKIRLLHTEGSRVTAIFAAILVLFAAVLGSGVLYIVDGEFQDQIIQFAGADIAAVAEGYRMAGVREAREVITQRMAAPGASDFFLLQRGQCAAGGKPARHAAENRHADPSLSGPLPHPGNLAGHAIFGAGRLCRRRTFMFFFRAAIFIMRAWASGRVSCARF